MYCLTYIYFGFYFQYSKSQWDSRDGDGDSQCDRHNEFEVHIYLLRKLQKKGMCVKSLGVGPRKEERRRRTVQLVMKGKLEDAILVHRWSRRKLAKVEIGTWEGHNDYLQDHYDQRGRESLERREGQEQEEVGASWKEVEK